MDIAIHRLNHYPINVTVIGFPNTYPFDSDLSGGKRYPTFEQLGSDEWEEGNVLSFLSFFFYLTIILYKESCTL